MSRVLLKLAKPFVSVLPEISGPDRRIPLREKLLWTLTALFVFLLFSQLPLFGAERITEKDSLFWMRGILMSNRGSLMELGVGPLVTASLSFQLLTGIKLIQFDSSRREDRELYQSSLKIVTVLITLVQAAGYVFTGAYGSVSDLGLTSCFLILAQLVAGGFIVILLDEMLVKGYGIGNATNLFILAKTCENILWSAISPLSIESAQGKSEFEGSIPFLFQLLFTNPTRIYAAFFRGNGPNLTSLFATLVVAVLALYIQGFRIEIPVKYQKVRSMQTSYPIKLLYAGNTPAVLLTAVASNYLFVSQVLYGGLRSNFLVNLLGQWQSVSADSRLAVPVGGLAYWISPPGSILELFSNPLHMVVYLCFVVLGCTFFGRYWIEVTNSGSREVAKNLKDHNLTMRGYRDSTVVAVLDKYIPTTAALGGFAIGFLTVVADVLGCIGSGAGLVLAITIVYQYFELIVRESSQYGL